LFSLITIASLSVGCCGALLASANIRQHLSFERWIPHADRIALVRETLSDGGGRLGEEARLFKVPRDQVNLGLHDAIAGVVKDMTAQTRITRCSVVKWPDAPVILPGQVPAPPPPVITTCVDPDFFRVFELEFVEGNAASALTTPDSLVISQKIARKYFGDGPAVGKTIEGRTAGTMLRVSAVLRDAPAATHLSLDAIAHIDLRLRPPGGNSAPPRDSTGLGPWTLGQHFIRMAEDADSALFRSGARTSIQNVSDARQQGRPAAIDGQSFTNQFSLVPLLDIHLAGEDVTGMQSSGDVSMLVTLATAAAALLGVSAFNYVTLSLARALRRRREIGIRKVLGAGHGDLMRHYLTESALVTAISMAIGFALAELLHPWFARTIGQPEALFRMNDPAFLAGAFAAFAILSLTVGAYPAFYLANVRPRAGLESSEVGRSAGIGGLISTGLLGLQIAAATVLLAAAFTMSAQMAYVANRPLGFDFRGMYTSMGLNCPGASIRGPRSPELQKQIQTAQRLCHAQFLHLLRATPVIRRVATSDIFNLIDDSILTYPFGRSTEGEELGKTAHYSVGFDYLQTLGSKLVAGRFFDANSAYDRLLDTAPRNKMGWPDVVRAPAIVSRAMLPLIGAATPHDALGQVIHMQEEAPYGMEIVGVVEDWHQRSLKFRAHPIVFTPSERGQIPVFEVIAEDPDAIIQDVRARWSKLVGTPVSAFPMIRPAERSFATFYESDQKLMQAVASFSTVATLVAAVGVFGLSSFEMRRRIREIAVRKALGATPWRITTLVVSREILFAGIASVLAWPAAYWIAEGWLTSFAYRTALGPTLLPLASAIVLAAVAVAVGISAVRAAAIRPSSALRES
jgi:putative ABC transport system permease protein